ncbi:hypothetical protein MHYP_G00084520 [Metynnis hypsauchen]
MVTLHKTTRVWVSVSWPCLGQNTESVLSARPVHPALWHDWLIQHTDVESVKRRLSPRTAAFWCWTRDLLLTTHRLQRCGRSDSEAELLLIGRGAINSAAQSNIDSSGGEGAACVPRERARDAECFHRALHHAPL